MISNKVWSGDGQLKRFLSDFIIHSEQHCRVYNYVYDAENGSDVSDILDPTTGLFIRATDAPQSTDIVTVDKFDLINNSIAFYIAPASTSRVYIEVATTPEEFGDVINQSQAGAAEGFANQAEQYATLSEQAFNSFDERYMGSFSTDPISGMTEGSMYFNSTIKMLKVYNGVGWIGVNEMVETTIYKETFAGTGSATLVFTNAFEIGKDQLQVFINGVYQEKSTYTENVDGITLDGPLAIGDTLEVVIHQETIVPGVYVTSGSNVSFNTVEGVTSITSPIGNIDTVNSTDVNTTNVGATTGNITTVNSTDVNTTNIDVNNITYTGDFITLNGVKMGAMSLTIADDDVATITLPKTGCFIFITQSSDTPYPQAQDSIHIWVDSGLTPGYQINTGFPSLGSTLTMSTGVTLTGTTGIDGETSINVNTDGTITIENRSGGSNTYDLTFL